MRILSPISKSRAFVTAGLAVLAALSTTAVLAQNETGVETSALAPMDANYRQVLLATLPDAKVKCARSTISGTYKPYWMYSFGASPLVQGGQRLYFAQWKCRP
ncbi:hypothetical protein HG421_05690 [Xanthomonas campestris pv. badrii]|uniref:Secreted protein n=1 Tax=Xanthomonas campestris pv. badrii TaxID=149696 RepID=A0A7Z2V8Z8_XANCA|nr:hypothetical protein [Xanthomonas campestris]QJD67262.1 hypothetical protein HG421_05690 [Xanthomonas campestris pv. badrii]